MAKTSEPENPMSHGDNPVDQDCPSCPTESALQAIRERNQAEARSKREALLAEIAASPEAFVHLVEAYDLDAPEEAIVLQVSSSLDLARRFCRDLRMSEGQVCEIRPHRVDGTRHDGNVVLEHHVRTTAGTTSGEGRHYPPPEPEEADGDETFVVTGSIRVAEPEVRIGGQAHCVLEVPHPYPHQVRLVIRGPDDYSVPIFASRFGYGVEVVVTATRDHDVDLQTTIEGVVPTTGVWPEPDDES